MNPYIFGIVVPFLVLFYRNRSSVKRRGLPADVGGERGLALRNHRFTSPLSSAWEDVTTLAELFERACREHHERFLLGTRSLIAREMESSPDGRTFEKLHLGDYQWLTYGRVFESVTSFASGLALLGHRREERVAIFAETRERWFIALQVFASLIWTTFRSIFVFLMVLFLMQGCFRRNVTVVTIYSSLGEEALCHSLNEVCSLFMLIVTDREVLMLYTIIYCRISVTVIYVSMAVLHLLCRVHVIIWFSIMRWNRIFVAFVSITI